MSGVLEKDRWEWVVLEFEVPMDRLNRQLGMWTLVGFFLNHY